MASKVPDQASAGQPRCPICRDATKSEYKPFCSARCRDVDLSRWLRGTYAIPGGQVAADEDGEDAAARQTAPEGADPDDENAP